MILKEIVTYTVHDKFNAFVNEFMNRRQQAMIDKNKGKELFFKTYLNGSYGYDGMNEEKFTKSTIKNKKETFIAQLSGNFMSTRKMCNDRYQVNYNPKSFGCNTALQCAAFTLDNAKYWYLNYYYNVFSKCIDMEKVHITHGDTDSIYFAVAGNPNENVKQLFDYVIKDKEFYKNIMYKFLPNPKINTIADEKKINGCAIEKVYTELIALGPKCYAGDEVCIVKGVSLDQIRKNIFFWTYQQIRESFQFLKKFNFRTILQFRKNNAFGTKINSEFVIFSGILVSILLKPKGTTIKLLSPQWMFFYVKIC